MTERRRHKVGGQVRREYYVALRQIERDLPKQKRQRQDPQGSLPAFTPGTVQGQVGPQSIGHARQPGEGRHLRLQHQ